MQAVCYIIITARETKRVTKKGEKPMDELKKALQDLAKALESNETVSRVTVTITLVKPKPDKATKSK